MSRFSAPKTFLVCFALSGCAEPQPETPPVFDAIGSIQEIADARDAQAEAERRQKQKAARESNTPNVPNAGRYVVEFDTTAGKFVVEVNREWAPLGADRFYNMVKDGFYDGAGFFRVVPGFMVQWGLAADPQMTTKWSTNIQDDPVTKSNTRGYITFAKTGMPNSRSSQVFINYGNNARLDSDGFAPFGKVIEGMDVVDSISSAHGQKPDQGMVRNGGTKYLKSNFPKLDYINSATLLEDDFARGQAFEVAPPVEAPPE